MTEAGRELDALVAETVFGIPRYDHGQAWADSADAWGDGLPRFSADARAAFAVVAQLNQDGWHVTVRSYRTGATADVTCPRGPCEAHGNPHHDWHGVQGVAGATVPEAICRAALAAIRAEEDARG